MADERLDSDYHEHPYQRRRLTIEEVMEQIKKTPLPRPQYDLVVELADGSRAICAHDGWYALDEERRRPDFNRPVEVPRELY